MNEVKTKEIIMRLVKFAPFAVNVKPLLDIVEELERLAEIGRATEKAFEKDGEFEINLGTHSTFYNVNELVEYFKED